MVCETMLPVSWEEQGRLYQQFELCTGSLQELAETENNIPERLIWGYLVDLLQVQYSCTESTDREQHPGAAHLGIPGGPAPGIQLYRQRTTSRSGSSGDTWWTCSRYSTVVQTENNNPEQLIWEYLVDLLQVYSCTDREQQPGAAHLGIPGGPAPGIVVQLCIHRGGAIRVTLMWIQSLPG